MYLCHLYRSIVLCSGDPHLWMSFLSIPRVCLFVWLGKIFNMYSLIFFLFRQWLSICRTRGAPFCFSRARGVVGGASLEMSKPVRAKWLPKRAAAPASICVCSCVLFAALLSVFVCLTCVCVGEHVFVCLFAYVFIFYFFAKKLTFKTQKFASKSLVFVCVFVFASVRTNSLLRPFDFLFCFCFDLSLYALQSV